MGRKAARLRQSVDGPDTSQATAGTASDSGRCFRGIDHPVSKSVDSVIPAREDGWPLVAVVGPTASAKSALALNLAEELDAEILNCDSIQVYRGLNIGSGKVPRESRERVPHHLFDLVDPDEHFSAGDYRREAEKVLDEVRCRQRLPLVVGGTGLYLRVLLSGLFASPARSDRLRRRLRRVGERKGRPYLHRLLVRRDPAAAAGIEPSDMQKVIRALEVCLLAGQPISELWASGDRSLRGFHPIVVGLDPPRELLRRRIDRRVERMFQSGLLQEVEQLSRRGYSPGTKSLGSLGYRQACAVLQGTLTVGEAIQATQRETRRYAKRQMTWFRHQARPQWFAGFGDDPAILRQVRSWLAPRLGRPATAALSQVPA